MARGVLARSFAPKHMWTASWQALFFASNDVVGCGHMSGLLTRKHMSVDTRTHDRIRELNDAFRKGFDPKLGQTMLTSGVNSLPSDVRAMAIRKTVTFDAFTPENDPQQE